MALIGDNWNPTETDSSALSAPRARLEAHQIKLIDLFFVFVCPCVSEERERWGGGRRGRRKRRAVFGGDVEVPPTRPTKLTPSLDSHSKQTGRRFPPPLQWHFRSDFPAVIPKPATRRRGLADYATQWKRGKDPNERNRRIPIVNGKMSWKMLQEWHNSSHSRPRPCFGPADRHFSSRAHICVD